MANYNKVQFISWEVHTGPVMTTPPAPGAIMGWINKLFGTAPPDPKATAYAGLANPFHDIEARVAFTKDAIGKAAASAAVDKAPTTLKVFMAPEFLFRGTVGAYIHDFINGWDTPPPGIGTVDPGYKTFPGLFGLLKKTVAVPDYENWIFVFGTAISASWDVPHTQPSVGPSATQSATIYNTALIQAGGAANGGTAYASQKHYTSGIDFITSRMPDILHMQNIAPGQQTALIQETVLVNSSGDLVGLDEGNATFELTGIDDKNSKPIEFGVEVCLDHARSSNVGQVIKPGDTTSKPNDYGRIKTAGKTVRLQLVPSGGMSLKAASICLDATQGSYAFNCDGLTNFANQYGAHTQVWDARLQPICQEPASKPAGTTTVVALDQSLNVSSPDGTGKVSTWASKGSDLWNNGKGVAGPGQVRIVPALSL